MLKKVLALYKFPLLAAVFSAVAIIALTVQKNPVQLLFVLLGALIGAFFLDLDYILHAYFLEPDDDFSKNVQGFIHHRDFKGLLNYIYYHKNDLKERTLNSAVFQLVLGGASILVVSSTASNFAKALVISAFMNSIYRLAEEHLEYKNAGDWFWAFKTQPDRKGLVIYSFLLVGVLILSFFLL
ncbi:hypothetical protein KJ605_01410 [Patescibacteria group bacterium]|nr:hypothetical protein [Patescibacteria group bacterium]MBU1970413.1 hypothetical protein [Patescibacteria group bacterium]